MTRFLATGGTDHLRGPAARSHPATTGWQTGDPRNAGVER